MLISFTTDDLVELQRLLQLPVEELEEYGQLYSALYQVEERDRRLGTNVVAKIKEALIELIQLEDAIALTQADSNYGATEVDKKINDEYEYKIKFNNNNGLNQGKIARQKYLINQIKRYLNWQNINKICLG